MVKIFFRSKLRPGPESRLVSRFAYSLPEPQSDVRRTVFVEPRIGSTRPDLVIIDWDPVVSAAWPLDRRHLELRDLRIAQLLYTQGTMSEEKLRFYCPRRLAPALERLTAAGLVTQDGCLWSLRELYGIFAIRRLIAVEAKVKDLSKALQQAFYDTWFASESYILTVDRAISEDFRNKAEARGVGLWLLDRHASRVEWEASQQSLPQSYMSLVFNELCWRASLEII